jgi:uncharacterized protein (TIGR03435 family)
MSTVRVLELRKPALQEFGQIFQEHYALVYRTAYSITRTAEDAEDVVQSIFLRLLRRESLPDLSSNPKGYFYRAAVGWIEGANVMMPYLASTLSQYMDHPVVDKTGFTEPFDFRLTWTPDSVESAARDTPLDPGCPASFATLRDRFGIKQVPASCPSIFSAVQEQLGLKLDLQKAPIDVLVIDHVEKASVN